MDELLLPIVLVGGCVVLTAAIVDIAKHSKKEQADIEEKSSQLKSKLGEAKSRNPEMILETAYHPVSDNSIKKIRKIGELNLDDENFGLSVSEVQDPGIHDWETSPSIIDQLSLLVSALPLDGVARHFGSTNYMIVEAGGPLLAAKGGGSRGMFKNPDKAKKIGHAVLHGTGLGDIVMNPAFIWNVGSFIFAQMHLHRISQTLSKMSAKLEKISGFQNDERLNGIIGNHKYILEVVEILGSSTAVRDETELNQVKQVYRETLTRHGHLLKDLRNVSITLKNKETASAGITEHSHLAAQLILVCQTRLQCILLLEVLKPDPKAFATRMKALWNEICKIPPIVNKRYVDLLDLQVGAANPEFRADVNLVINDASEDFEELFVDLVTNYIDMSRAAVSISGQNQQLLLKIVGASGCNKARPAKSKE